MVINTITKKLQTERIITIVEPHHDDFWLDCSGTMLLKDKAKEIDKIKILSVFGVSKQVSRMPTAIHKNFFDCEIVVKELWLKNLFNLWPKEKKREYKEKGGNCIKRFEEINGSYTKFLKKVEEFREGTLLLPAGQHHADHNLLSKIEGDYYYREYPYFSFDEKKKKNFSQSLYEEDEYETVARIKLDNKTWYAKWKIFAIVYHDVLGMFNPRWGGLYFRNVRDEVYMKKVVKVNEK